MISVRVEHPGPKEVCWTKYNFIHVTKFGGIFPNVGMDTIYMSGNGKKMMIQQGSLAGPHFHRNQNRNVFQNHKYGFTYRPLNRIQDVTSGPVKYPSPARAAGPRNRLHENILHCIIIQR